MAEYPPNKYGVYFELKDENGSWLNIWNDTLEEHFEEIKETDLGTPNKRMLQLRI